MKEHPYLAKSCRVKKSLNAWQIVQKISVKKEKENVEYFTRKRFSASATDRASGCGRRRFSHLSVSAQVNDN